MLQAKLVPCKRFLTTLERRFDWLRQPPDSSSIVSVFELAVQMTETDAGFGEMLRQRRDAAGLSAVRLAKRAGLCEGTNKHRELAQLQPWKRS